MVIAHNLAAINTQRMYGITTSEKKKTTEKLSSGYKINRAADDAAGLTISEKMRSQIRGLNQGSDNIQDGVSVVQIADGALAEVNDMLHRMTELSIKSANGTNSDADRAAIQEEIHEIIQEIDRIHESTEFNTMKLFDGDVVKAGTGQKLGGLVECEAADTEHLTQNYHNHPAAILDFKNINAGNVDKLYDKKFTFNCSASCSEEFSFKFVNGDGTSDSFTDTLLRGTDEFSHSFVVDINGLTSGTDIVNKIYSVVDANKNNIHFRGKGGSTGYVGNTAHDIGVAAQHMSVGHSNAIAIEGDKLIVYSNSTNPNQFTNIAKDYKYGRVDTSEITPQPVENGEMKPFWIQCSGTQGDGLNIEIEKMNAKYIGIDKIDVSTEGGARNAIEKIADASAHISAMRSDLGAYQNRLEHAYANNQNKAENTTAAESRIRDTDMAAEMVRLSMQNILQQAGESMLAQANQSTQGVLSLLS